MYNQHMQQMLQYETSQYSCGCCKDNLRMNAEVVECVQKEGMQEWI